MSTFLRKFIAGCADCQAAKVNTHPTIPGLSPLAVEHPLPFSSILVDLITGLPDSHGFDSVMVVVDHGLTKGVIYCPCTKNIDSEGVAQLFFTNVFPRFGLHSKIISDRGPQFASAFAQELACLLQYDVALSTAYHPQTDGETKQVNQELETYLRLFASNKPEEWSKLLPMAEFAHNSTTHSVLRGLRNLIPSSAHSGVVRRHVELFRHLVLSLVVTRSQQDLSHTLEVPRRD